MGFGPDRLGRAAGQLDLGTFQAAVSPTFLAIEGQGWADDVIARLAP